MAIFLKLLFFLFLGAVFVEVIFELKYSWIWLLNGSIYGFISLQWLAFPLHKVTSILMQCQGVSGRLTHKNLFVF